MTRSEIAAAFAGLPPRREFPGERVWCQRVDTLERFLTHGAYQAQCFRDLAKGRRRGLESVREEFGRAAPALFDLLMEAFPPGPDRVREPGA